MAARLSGPILQLIGQIFTDSRVWCCDDQELLRRFLERQDEAAFEALIRRHGPLVIDVCRSLLPNEADVEDAFQTTFLVLARKAASVRKAASLASWLHGVAYRTACRARTSLARRARHEACTPPRQPPEVSDGLAWREVRQIVHEELNALPDRYRSPLLLCYMEGLTQDQAAASLRVARSTLKIRLERGRELLRGRLVRRGLGPEALVVATAWPLAGQAGLPTAIVISTVKSSTAVAAGGAASSAISAEVAALLKGGLDTMRYASMKTAIAWAVGIGSLGAGATMMALPHLRAGVDPPPPPPRAQLAARERPPTPGARTSSQKAGADEAQVAARKALEARRALREGIGSPGAEPGKSDEENLRGDWTAVSGEASGRPLPAETLRGYRLTFAEGKATVQLSGESKEGKLKLDPAAKPKAIDLDLDGGTGTGIYSLVGDTLTLCFAEGGKEDRPTEFTTKEGGRSVLLILKRAARAKPAGGSKEAGDRGESPQVAALKQQLRALEAMNEVLKEDLKRSREELAGTLTKVDADKKTVGIRLKGTKLTLDAIPLSGDAKFLVGDREVSLNEMEPGMSISLQLRTEDERTVITAVQAAKPGQ